MRAQTLTLALVALVAGAACSKLNLPGNFKPQLNSRVASDLAEVKKKRERCGEIEKQPVAFDEEQTIGQTVGLNVIGGRGVLEDEKLTRYVNIVGSNLASYSARPGLPWTFGIIDDAHTVNAFATPGGYVFITSGLLAKVENEAQLAGVLAHEITHITERHALGQYSRFKANVCNVEVAKETGASMLGPTIDGMLNSPVAHLDFASEVNFNFLDNLTTRVADWITREGPAADQERSSDVGGLRLMALAGYQPEEFIRFVKSLGAAGQKKKYASSEERAGYMNTALERLKKDGLSDLPDSTPWPEENLVSPPLPREARAVSQR